MIWLPLLLQQPYLDHLSFIMHWPALCSPNRPTLSHLSTFILPVTLPRTHFHHILGWPASCNSGLSSAVASSRGHPWLPYLNCPPNPLVTPFISFMPAFIKQIMNLYVEITKTSAISLWISINKFITLQWERILHWQNFRSTQKWKLGG